MEPKISLPSPLEPAEQNLSSKRQREESQDPINKLFLTQLTQIFAKKYALSMDSSEETRKELRRMLEDLKRVQKWTESTMRQTEKALQEPVEPLKSREPTCTSPPKRLVNKLVAWFKRISTI